MNKASRLLLKTSFFVLTLAVAAGCDFFGKKAKNTVAPEPMAANAQGDGVVLCSIDGQPVLKESEFINNLNQMLQANPYFRGATIESLPKELQRKFFDQLVTQAIIEKHATKSGIQNDPEFIKSFAEAEKVIKRSLMVQLFEKKIYDKITVSENEIQKYYNENKDRFVKVPGGVKTLGARFENEAAADLFVAKANKNQAGFEKIAKADKNAKFRDFGLVSKEQKGMQFDVVPGPVKEAVLAFRNFPHIEKVKTGKEYWVVCATQKQDAEIFPLEEVKQHIDGMLKNNSFRDVYEKEVKEIKGTLSVNVNEDYFKQAAPAGEAQEEAGLDEALAAEQASAAA
jgi:peptidyl-prolyl cis-trans isomerase C